MTMAPALQCKSGAEQCNFTNILLYRVSVPFSLNLSMAASIFLISRIETDNGAYSMLILALVFFAFLPMLRNRLFELCSPMLPMISALLLSSTCLALLYSTAPPLVGVVAALQLFILVVCPSLYARMQFSKSTIHGPWDEACLKTTIMDQESYE